MNKPLCVHGCGMPVHASVLGRAQKPVEARRPDVDDLTSGAILFIFTLFVRQVISLNLVLSG